MSNYSMEVNIFTDSQLCIKKEILAPEGEGDQSEMVVNFFNHTFCFSQLWLDNRESLLM